MSEENLVKSLTQLIDETLQEIEVLKKGRFDASTICLGDEKANGCFETKCVNKSDDEDEDDEDDKEEKAEKAEEEAKKAEKPRWFASKAEEEVAKKAEKLALKSDDKDEDDEDEEDDEFKKAEECYKAACVKRDMKKAEKKGINVEKMEEVKKSIDARILPLEAQLAKISNMVQKLADAPVGARGHTFRSVQPLAKSDSSEPLSKTQVLDRLVDLKKSGKDVSTDDVIRAECGGQETVNEIATKYGLK